MDLLSRHPVRLKDTFPRLVALVAYQQDKYPSWSFISGAPRKITRLYRSLSPPVPLSQHVGPSLHCTNIRTYFCVCGSLWDVSTPNYLAILLRLSPRSLFGIINLQVYIYYYAYPSDWAYQKAAVCELSSSPTRMSSSAYFFSGCRTMVKWLPLFRPENRYSNHHVHPGCWRRSICP